MVRVVEKHRQRLHPPLRRRQRLPAPSGVQTQCLSSDVPHAILHTNVSSSSLTANLALAHDHDTPSLLLPNNQSPRARMLLKLRTKRLVHPLDRDQRSKGSQQVAHLGYISNYDSRANDAAKQERQ